MYLTRHYSTVTFGTAYMTQQTIFCLRLSVEVHASSIRSYFCQSRNYSVA